MRPPTDNTLVLGNLREYRQKWYTAKTTFSGLHFCGRKCRCIFNHFYVMRPESYRIRWNNTKLGILLTSYLAPFPRYGLWYVQNRYIWLPLLRSTPSPKVEGFPWDDLRKLFRGCQRMAKVPNNVETYCWKFQPAEWAHERYTRYPTDRRQTDGQPATA